jgi:hypothetical protein
MRFAGLLLVAVAACKSNAPDTAQQQSPQASAQPAPFAMPLVAAVNVSTEGGPPPAPMRGDVALEAEATGKDAAGYTITVVVRLPDAPAVASGANLVNTAVVEAMRKQNEPRFTIDLSAGRMRMQLASPGFFLARDAELRARIDRYGHVFVTPDLSSYRVLAPGSLRALFAERRVDVSPLSPAEVALQGDGLRRLGYRTRKVEVQSRAGKGIFEITKLPDLGDGGALLTRALLDLMNAAPQTSVVATDELPLHAELQWPSRGAVFFDVTSITKRADLSSSALAVPPNSAVFATGPLQPVAGELRVEVKELSTIHTGPVDLGAEAASVTAGSLVLTNPHDTPRFAWIDGAPVAWVAPEGRVELGPLPRGRYQLEWRSFLDDAADGPKTVTVPVLAAAHDAGAHP